MRVFCLFMLDRIINEMIEWIFNLCFGECVVGGGGGGGGGVILSNLFLFENNFLVPYKIIGNWYHPTRLEKSVSKMGLRSPDVERLTMS